MDRGCAHEISPPHTIGRSVGKPNEEADGLTVEQWTERLLEVEIRWVETDGDDGHANMDARSITRNEEHCRLDDLARPL